MFSILVMQVYRPRCESQWRKFCYRSFSCIRLRDNCEDFDSIWNRTCSGNGTFSFTSRNCFRDNSLQSEHIFSGIPIDYDYVGEFQYIIESLGRNFVSLNLSNHIEVFKGDVIGWYNSDQGKLAYVESTESDGSEFLPDLNGFDSRNTGEYTAAMSGATAHSYKHSLKAHIVRPSVVHVYHNYTWPENRRNISVLANSSFATDEGVNGSFSIGVFDVQEIKVQEYIKNLTFIATNLGKKTLVSIPVYTPDHLIESVAKCGLCIR